MSYKYQYDESGLASSYLALSFILPITLYFSYKFFFKKNISRLSCKCVSCKNLPKERNFFGNFSLIFLWILVSILLKNVLVIKLDLKRDFDPFEILGIDINTNPKLIKKKMVKMMLKYNVDRCPENKKKEYEEKIIEISKAYNIVKDKNTFAKWLNNESKSGEIMAIPDVIMKNATLAFIIYCLILGLCLPNYAYRKWKNIKTKNSLGVQFDSMECFINFINEDLKKKCDIKNLLVILTKSKEFSTKKFSSNAKNIKSNIEYNFGYPLPDVKNLNEGFLVLMDHLFRLNECKEKDLDFIKTHSLILIDGMKCVAITKGYTEIYKKLFTLQAMILQSVFDEEYFLLQYPHVKFSDLFLKKISGQKVDVQEALSNLLSGQELKDALLVHENIKKIVVKEFSAATQNTGNLNDASDVEDEDKEDLIVKKEKIKNFNTFKIENKSLVTIKVRLDILNKSKIEKCVHTYNIKERSLCTWSVFLTVDNILHKNIEVIDEKNLKDVMFTFDAPADKISSEVKLYIMNGQYLRNNVEETIILKYY
ncbi:protein transport protein SEC63 [Vairimorpha necatrix]|uniref:Protein transport protein SEC63 n=1 Tax=Vairimorpha necatrix TaxID=6039 RepID=A0AAX4J9L9_9MICR